MARPTWSGSITFGLVNIPVQLFTAARDTSVRFNQLCPSKARVKQKLVCEDTGEEISSKETLKGYAVSKDQYVVIEKDDLAALKPRAEKTITITDFVDLASIDPIYFDMPYYVIPDKGGAKGYRLLVQAMTDAKRVGIAKFIRAGKEYLVALRPLNGYLVMETMRFADEVVPAGDIGEPPKEEVSPKELDLAHKLIDALAGEFKPEKYRDEYRAKVLELIEKKAAGQKIEFDADDDGETPRVFKLMEALEASIKQKKPAPKGRTGKRTKGRAA